MLFLFHSLHASTSPLPLSHPHPVFSLSCFHPHPHSVLRLLLIKSYRERRENEEEEMLIEKELHLIMERFQRGNLHLNLIIFRDQMYTMTLSPLKSLHSSPPFFLPLPLLIFLLLKFYSCLSSHFFTISLSLSLSLSLPIPFLSPLIWILNKVREFEKKS